MGQSKPFRSIAVLVEDDPLQREMIALMLEESGFHVIQCEDAETAVLALKSRRPTLLITDVALVGEMSGLELADRARQLHPSTRIIVISGTPVRALPDGAVFFSKPYPPLELLREVNKPFNYGAPKLRGQVPEASGEPGPKIDAIIKDSARWDHRRR